MNQVPAVAIPVAHAALVVFLIAGSWLTVRWPRVLKAHLVAIAATGAVFLAGADCPLTVWENHFRAAAGWSTYDGGFIAHHLVAPITGSEVLSPAVQVLLVASWTVPTALGYAARRRRIAPAAT